MAKNKTTETNFSVEDYINNITDEKRQKDVRELVRIFEEVSGFPPKMWGEAIIGFGSYHYKYASGHEGDAPIIAFSPRANAISLYFGDFKGRDELLKIFGKHKVAVSCIYIKKLADVDMEVLKKIIAEAGSAR